MTMLEVNTSLRGVQRREIDFDLGDAGGVVFPVAVDLPGEDQPGRGLPLQHLAPFTLCAIFAALIPSSSRTRFDYDRHLWRGADGFRSWPPTAHATRECLEGSVHVCC